MFYASQSARDANILGLPLKATSIPSSCEHINYWSGLYYERPRRLLRVGELNPAEPIDANLHLLELLDAFDVITTKKKSITSELRKSWFVVDEADAEIPGPEPESEVSDVGASLLSEN